MTGQAQARATEWADQVAVVTGGRGDIGRAVVSALLASGARVASADLPASGRRMPQPEAHLREDEVDAADPRAVAAWLDAVAAQWGPPTIAVLAAGASGSGRLVDTSADDWHAVLAACLDSSFVASTEAIRRMIAAGRGGRVVFVGSWAAHAPHPHIGAYSVAKAGLRALCRTLALDHAVDGILVNEVAPGIVDAGLSRRLFAESEALRQRTLGAIPVERMLTPEDVARDVLFLCSPDNTNTTGAVIVSDGGLSLASEMNPGHRDDRV